MKQVSLVDGFDGLRPFVEGLLFVIEKFRQLSEEFQNKTGGYLTILCRKTGQVMRVIKVGDFPLEKSARYFSLSLEKAQRLFNSEPGVLTSFETRNSDEDKYGGAIRTTDYILSFSGLTEEGDSAVLLRVANSFDMIDPESFAAIQSIIGDSVSPIYPNL